MIEALFEFVFSFVAELVFEIFGEVLIELGFYAAAETLSGRTQNPWLLGFAYTFFGAILGFLSLFVFNKVTFAQHWIVALYFIVSPLIAGLSLTVASYIIHRGHRPVRLFEPTKFISGVLFALAYSISRVYFG